MVEYLREAKVCVDHVLNLDLVDLAVQFHELEWMKIESNCRFFTMLAAAAAVN